MDSVKGSGHRLKFGHSIEYLPEIVERFGLEGVPAYFVHLLQDFTTMDGIPVVPYAWQVKKKILERAGVPAKIATGIVSVSFSSTLGALGVIGFVHHLSELGSAIRKRLRVQNYLKTASAAIQSRDYNAAIGNYRRALEVDRNPLVLIALGQVYMQRAATRFRAHQSFLEALTLLADSPALTIPYKHAALSARGLASLQALATADVLKAIHPEHWNDHVQDLVNAAVFSFSSTASEAAQQSDDLIPDVIVPPSQFTAAINYMLAARSACLYPFAEQREETVVQNLQSASRSLGLVAHYNEQRLRQPINTIRQLWALELLPPDEAETTLTTY